MPAPTNTIKRALKEGRLQMGCWLNLAHPAVAAITASADYDWCLIDAEHGPNTLDTIIAQLHALQATGAEAVVRVPASEEWMLKQVLDLGVQTIVVPMVNTAAQAAAIVAACQYPPEGVRGRGAALARATNYGAIADYEPSANYEICVIVQAETREALENLAEIAATPGVDCVFVGPADLSADMGFRDHLDAPEVVEAIDTAIDTITAAGTAAGIIIFDDGLTERFRKRGATFVGVGSDATVYAKAIRERARATRALLQ